MTLDFAASVKRFSEQSKKSVHRTRRIAVFQLFSAIVKDTPVDKGVLRGNWQTSLSAPKGGELGARGSQAAISEILTVTAKLKNDASIWLVNNKRYAHVVEFGLYPNPPKSGTGKTADGYSRKAPQGMVRRNVVNFQRLLAIAVRVG